MDLTLRSLVRLLLLSVTVGLLGCSASDGAGGTEEDVGSISQATTQACLSAPLPGECRYTPTGAAASSVESGASEYDPNRAVDGNCTTRWSSAFSDPQWLKVDLGSVRPLSRLVIHWESAASSNYEIQVSNDASAWTKVATKANATITGSGNSRADTIAGLTASARYVRLYSLARTTTYGNSVFELEVFGTGCGAPAGCSHIPVAIVGATASSQENSAKGPDKTIDGLSSTRWSSAFSDPQWLQLDLGRTLSLGRIAIDWENSASAKYEIQVSDSPSGPWMVAHAHSDNRVGPRTDDITGLNATGRYVRIYSTKRTTTYGISLYEVRVFRESCTGCEQVLVPSATAGSSSESTTYAASKAVDGDFNTRWSSQFSDPQWLRLDFGQARQINQVVIRWEAAASKSYRLEGAASASGPWQIITQRSNQAAGPRWDFITGLAASARFLRVYSTARTGTYGNSIIEIAALGPSLAGPCSGHGRCVEAIPPGQKDCDCDAKFSGLLCGSSTVPNSDDDTKVDPEDGCPFDSAKIDPLICNCNHSEVDSDGDEVPDCEDFCPNDPKSQTPLPCGCDGASNVQPAGTPCMVERCSGSRQEGTCDGHGQCVGGASCQPLPTGCKFLTFRDHGYWVCTASQSWQQAEALCRQEPGRSMAKVNDRVENLWLANLTTTDTWLGGNTLVSEDTWAWSYSGLRDETPFWVSGLPIPNRYSQWQVGSPVSGQCLKLLDNGKWSDAPCGEGHGFICEQPLLKLPPPIKKPCACDYFPGVSCASCDEDPGTPGPCIEGHDEFPHSDDNPDKEDNFPVVVNTDLATVEEQARLCKEGCQSETDTGCATACQGFAAVPPVGGCTPFTPEQGAYCELESVFEGTTCSVDQPTCAQGRCGRRYQCLALDADKNPTSCAQDADCPSGRCDQRLLFCIDPNHHSKCDYRKVIDGKDQCVGICFGLELIRFPGHQTEQVSSWSPEHGEEARDS